MQSFSRVFVLSSAFAGICSLAWPADAHATGLHGASRLGAAWANAGDESGQRALEHKSANFKPLDARLLCAPSETSVSKGGLGLFEGPGGLVLQPVAAGTECKLLATGANLNIQFPGQGAILLGGPVNYRLSETPRRAEFSVIEPLLCESYYTATDRLSLRITDSNGVERNLGGVLGLSYAPGLGRVAPSLVQAAGERGPLLQCFSFPFAQLTTNPPAPPAPLSQSAMFRSGFESTADLRVEILDAGGDLLISRQDAVLNSAFSYRIRVRNVGEAPAAGVVVREFVPTGNLYAARINPGTWSCETSTGANCTPATGAAGALVDSGITLAPGAYRTYTLSRTVISGTPPNRTVLAAAAFADPLAANAGFDPQLGNNSAPLIIELVPNQLPQFACSYPDRNLPADSSTWVWNSDLPVTITLDEVIGGAPAAVEFECRVRDPDAGEGFALTGSPTNSNPALVPNADLVTPIGVDGDHFDVRIAPAAAQIGSALIVQTATDDRLGVGRVRVNLEVRDVNAPPEFELLYGELALSPAPIAGPMNDGDGNQIPLGLYSRANNCFDSGNGLCQITFPQFIFDTSIGVPPESPGQQLVISVGTCSPAGMLQGNIQITPSGPVSADTEFQLQFSYLKSNAGANTSLVVTCPITATDTGNPPGGPVTRNLILRYQQ
ncbi:MAG: DUF11 domain-containing protein [Aquimonas sp.]|nr:DUF11 domain-containing protein [Aquimonas sp.]